MPVVVIIVGPEFLPRRHRDDERTRRRERGNKRAKEHCGIADVFDDVRKNQCIHRGAKGDWKVFGGDSSKNAVVQVRGNINRRQLDSVAVDAFGGEIVDENASPAAHIEDPAGSDSTNLLFQDPVARYMPVTVLDTGRASIGVLPGRELRFCRYIRPLTSS